MKTRDRLIGTSRLVVRAATAINRLFLLAVSLALLLSLVFSVRLGSALAASNPGVDAPSELAGLRFEMLIGIAMAIATDRLLTKLAQIIASASVGDPFNATNAHRLQTIGWSLLVLQLLDVPAAILSRVYPGLGSSSPFGDVSAGGWMAVLMVFILSRVFAQGSLMRDELDGTI